jgi:hypothetical protein
MNPNDVTSQKTAFFTVCFLLIVLIFLIASASVSLLGWVGIFRFRSALPISAFHQNAWPGISLAFVRVGKQCRFALPDRFSLCRVKVACVGVVWFSWNQHFFPQSSISLMEDWTFTEAIAGSSRVANVAILLAEAPAAVLSDVLSLVYIRYTSGLKTLPCGIPASILLKVVISSSNCTCNSLSVKHDSNVLYYAWGRVFLIPNNKSGCHTLSNACASVV